MTPTEAALRDDTEAKAVLTKMIEDRSSWAANNQRMLDLLQPEWERFEAREGHNVYVARIYADHTSSLRKDRKELAALEYALAALSQPSPASSTAGDAYELGYRQAVIDGENSRFLSSLAQPLSPLSSEPASPLDQVMRSNPGWQEITQADRDALGKIMASSGLPADILTILVAHRMAGEPASVAVEADPLEVGFWKEKAEHAERERDVWKERAMDLRLSKPTPVEAGMREAVAKQLSQALVDRDEGRFKVVAFLNRHTILAALSETLPDAS